MADTTGQLHPHYRTAVKAAGVAALGLAAAVFAAVNPGDAKNAAVVAGCVALYAGARWGAKKLGLRGSLRMPPLRRSAGGGAGRGRSASLFKRGSGGGKALGGGRRAGGLLRGKGIGQRGGSSGRGKLLPKLGRGGSRKGGGALPGTAGRRGGLFRRGGKGKSAAGGTPSAGRRGGLLRRAGKGSPAGKGSAAGRRGLSPFKRSGRKGSGSKIGSGSGGRGRFMPKLGKRSGRSSSGRSGSRLGGGGKGIRSPFRRGGGRSSSPFKRRGGSGSAGGRSRAPGIFRRGSGSAGKGRGLGVFRRGSKSGTGTGSRPGGLAAGLRRYAKAAPKRKLNGWQKAALGAGKLAAAPFALAWLGGRWAWRKARKAPAQPDPEPAPKGAVRPKKEKPADKPVPSAAPEDPGRVPARLHDFTGGPTIMNHIDAATEAAQAHIGGWEPENAADLDLFLSSLPAYFDGVAGAFRTVAAKLADGYPVHPDVPDRLNEIASTIGGMADFSGEAHAVHRSQHQQEMERLENPRPGEQFWDVSKQ